MEKKNILNVIAVSGTGHFCFKNSILQRYNYLPCEASNYISVTGLCLSLTGKIEIFFFKETEIFRILPSKLKM